jgi:integrase
MGRPKAGARVRGPYEDKSRGRWRVDWFGPDGLQRPRYFSSERRAREFIDKFERGAEAHARSVAEAIPDYERHLKEKGDRDNSILTMRWALREFFPDGTVLSDLTPERCEALYKEVRTRPKRIQVNGGWSRPETGDPLSTDSHRGVLKQAKAFLRWCVRTGLLASCPVDGVRPVGRLRLRGKSLGKAGRRLRIREARLLYAKAINLAHGGDRQAAIVLTAILLGLRASEIVGLRVRDLDEDEYPGDVIHVEDRKNHEDLEVEVAEDLRPVLLALANDRAGEEFLFAGAKGQQLLRWHVLRAVHAVCDAAGIQRITAHACRGLLATVAAERGMAGHLIAATLGNDERVMGTAYAAPGALEAGGRRRGLAVLQGGIR